MSSADDRDPIRAVGSEPSRDNISRRAYELYCGDGYRNGRDVDHWLQAERELREQEL